ncbi:helix-turn-helix transcriptional regulator [Oceanobacillus sp. J11TS1]|uniref:helix-turn-helix transcriptional regulator n=1 Tax=Oceanobacillus sp. J11TS1 TaxID=2807191 RepID=UPI001B2569AA|nr:helix-turn-helix transcriptional regulator [Oceanobacillus sp. J11TS1]GIO25299.1 hypothetical protein J11TS1_38800 [Oceanobacillus sp. J11TS1]
MIKNSQINNNLKRFRDSRGLKSKFVAKKLGISPNYYSQIENGHRSPQLEHLLKLKELYNVSLDEIFFDNKIAKRDKEKEII